MIKIEAIIRSEVFDDVKEALNEIDINGITAYQVMGCGIQKGYTEVVRGKKIDLTMLPKIKLEIVVSTKEWADVTINTIKKVACTGNMGDGKIFAYDLSQVVRISTGQTGVEALL